MCSSNTAFIQIYTIKPQKARPDHMRVKSSLMTKHCFPRGKHSFTYLEHCNVKV